MGTSLARRRCRVEHEKLLTLSSPERHDHGASSLPAAINRPPDILPAGRNCEGFTRKPNINQKQGLNHENLQIVHCIRARLLCAFPRNAGSQPATPGGYPNFTTAAGDHALQALTSGVGNTAIGTYSLFSVTTGNFNT